MSTYILLIAGFPSELDSQLIRFSIYACLHKPLSQKLNGDLASSSFRLKNRIIPFSVVNYSANSTMSHS